MTRVFVLTLLSSLLAWGCYSKSAGKQLAREAEDRERRLAELENGMADQRRQIQESLASAEAKVAELEHVLERATEVVTRNSADLGTEVGQLRTTLATLEGQIAELRNELGATQRELSQQNAATQQRIKSFARKAGVDIELEASQVPQDKDAHFNAATTARDANDASLARALFREYARRYPEDDRTDNALHALAALYMQAGRPATALAEYRKIITRFRGGDMFNQTLYDMALAFYELHACTDARSALEALVARVRRGALNRRARTKLREIRRAPAGYCTS